MDSITPAVVDTDVVSFLFKTHSLAPAYQTILAGRQLAVSLITMAEIEYGMEVKKWGARLQPRLCSLTSPWLQTTREIIKLWTT
jgi:predicted nucleic acid-binding protein